MLKLVSIFSVVIVLGLAIFAQTPEINIIPQPKSVKMLNGTFELNNKTKLVTTDDAGRKSADLLNDLLLKNYGFKLEFVSSGEIPKTNVIIFISMPEADESILNEEYRLAISTKGIIIAGKETGQFYALQSLMQILPLDFKGKIKLSTVVIADEPRFKYRGMHLDVSRHFMPLTFVKKYIDLMSQYKFNYFHWHLTDDQGWRIEIKKYPKLTEIGSKRTESVSGRILNPYVGDGIPVEGFYTQEQIKDVVAYAKARHITVIPEIELPGHSSAALMAYPELGCKENYDYKVQTTWGIFKEVYCPTDKIFQFLEDVISEVVNLFPDSPYIHVGGDEVLKDFWKDSAAVNELKARENLKDEHEVQSYFIRRMEKFINSKGKKIIGWDEILEGGTAPNATIMSWRGEKGGIESAKAKHDVIMTPNTFLYLDYGQGDPKNEPLNIGGYLPLEKVYSYNPEPSELSSDEKKYILGAQGNIWTEYLKTPEMVEYMAFPRMFALSEVVWSPLEKKNYADFQKRLSNQLARLDKQNVNYRIPEPIGLQNIILTGNQDSTEISLDSIVPNSKTYYTTDKSEPTEKSNLYTKPFKLTLKQDESVRLNLITVNQKGRKSVVYGENIVRREPLAATELIDKKQGVVYSFYKQDFTSVNAIDKATPLKTGETKSINFNQFKDDIADKLPFAAIFSGYLNIIKDELYEFELESRDGAVLIIDGQMIVNNDGVKDKQTKSNLLPLKAGYHKLTLKFFKSSGDFALGLRWGIKGQNLSRINGSELFH